MNNNKLARIFLVSARSFAKTRNAAHQVDAWHYEYPKWIEFRYSFVKSHAQKQKLMPMQMAPLDRTSLQIR